MCVRECSCDLVALRTKSIWLFLVSCESLSQPVPEHTAALCLLSLRQDWTEFEEQKQEKSQVKIKNSLISEWKKEEKNLRDAKTNHSLPPTNWAMTAPVLLWAWCHVALWSNWGTCPNLLPIPEGVELETEVHDAVQALFSQSCSTGGLPTLSH